MDGYDRDDNGRDPATGRQYETVDPFDRLRGEWHQLPGVISSREVTITVTTIAESSTFTVQTLRHRELGDRIFLQRIDKRGTDRIAIPAPVCDAIARQRDQITARARSRAARAAAGERKAAGYTPSHLHTPEARRKALKARKAKAAKRRARQAAKRKAVR